MRTSRLYPLLALLLLCLALLPFGVGGYILGLIEALGAMYISVDYKDAFAFAVLVVVLAIRPQGLFGKAQR